MSTRDPFRGNILHHYVATALWSSCYCGDMDEDHPDVPETLDDIASPEDCAPALLAELRAECAAFLFHARRLLRPFIARDGMTHTLERVGHDLWLTAQGHGAGFWDGDWQCAGLDHGSELTRLAKLYGSNGRDLYCSGDFNSCEVT